VEKVEPEIPVRWQNLRIEHETTREILIVDNRVQLCIMRLRWDAIMWQRALGTSWKWGRFRSFCRHPRSGFRRC
jgi:hypothetical protein